MLSSILRSAIVTLIALTAYNSHAALTLEEYYQNHMQYLAQDVEDAIDPSDPNLDEWHEAWNLVADQIKGEVDTLTDGLMEAEIEMNMAITQTDYDNWEAIYLATHKALYTWEDSNQVWHLGKADKLMLLYAVDYEQNYWHTGISFEDYLNGITEVTSSPPDDPGDPTGSTTP